MGLSPMHQPENMSVPSFAISTDAMTGPEALAAFRQSVQDVFALTCLGDEGEYRLNLSAWHLGTIMVGRFQSSALAFERDAALVATSGLDHLLVQLYVQGGFAGVAANHPVVVTSGDIVIFDLAHGLKTLATDFTNISVLIPRSFLRHHYDDASALHGHVLPANGAMAAMLGTYMRALVDRLPTLTPGDAQVAARSTVALVTAMLADQGDGFAPAGPSLLSPFRKVAQEIDQRLREPSLDAVSLAHSLGMSRATLYRTFQPVGGIADYIRRRRLAVAAIMLSSPANQRRKIGEIARDCGFASESAFSRAFRSAFGIAPGRARQCGADFWSQPHLLAQDSRSLDFARWMRMLHP